MVRCMLVPVSPSGTGYTFRALTSSTNTPSHCVAKMNALPSSLAPIVACAVPSGTTDALDVDPYGAQCDAGEMLGGVHDTVPHAARHHGDVDAVRDDDVDIDVRLERLRRSEEHTSELQSRENLVCRLLLE